MKRLISLFLLVFLTACTSTPTVSEVENPIEDYFPALEANEALSQASFAAGCFWCSEAAFQELDGVEEAISGYVGGTEVDPTYEEVVSHKTSHREGLRVYYYADQISYEELLDVFWASIDPTDAGGQFADRGFNYTTAIFYHDEAQKTAAEASKLAVEESGKYSDPIATEIIELTSFYPAEEYHQDFYKHSAERYQQYKYGSGRVDYFGE
jgi:peptide methionine sulfoxide reductase msrA/msrB